MDCPRCNHAFNDVTQSRTTKEGYVRRRRRCRACSACWSTFEIPVVVDGRYDFGPGHGLREAFDLLLLQRATVAFRSKLDDALEPLKQLRASLRR